MKQILPTNNLENVWVGEQPAQQIGSLWPIARFVSPQSWEIEQLNSLIRAESEQGGRGMPERRLLFPDAQSQHRRRVRQMLRCLHRIVCELVVGDLVVTRQGELESPSPL